MNDSDNTELKVVVSESDKLGGRRRERILLVSLVLGLIIFSLVAGYLFSWWGLLLVVPFAIPVLIILVRLRRMSLTVFAASATGIVTLGLISVSVGQSFLSPSEPLSEPTITQAERVYYWQSSTDKGLFLRSNFDVVEALSRRSLSEGSAFLLNAEAARPGLVRALNGSYLVCSTGPITRSAASRLRLPQSDQRTFLVVLDPKKTMIKNIDKIIPPPYPDKPWCSLAKNKRQLVMLNLSSLPRYGDGGLNPEAIRRLNFKKIAASSGGLSSYYLATNLSEGGVDDVI